MKRNSTFSGRLALTGVAAAALWLAASNAHALGLGRLSVQSALGEALRAEIDVTSLTAEEAGTLRVRVAPPEAYRAAGVDYNTVLPATQVDLQRRTDGRPYLRVTSDRAVQEPFVDVILEISWASGRLVREYTMLFDPPAMARAPAQPAPAAAPSIAAAPPAPAPAQAAAPSPAPRAARPVPESKPAVAAVPAPSSAAATAPTGADEYKVRQGDTLFRIAGKHPRQGVSLDQMLVSLYKANPEAFIANNMNRLKSGVVLSVPSAEDARAVSTAEARQLIQAQSADFGAYRQRLAGAVPAARDAGSTRQAAGTVQTEVQDRKQAAAPAPDKLTLSKGDTAGKASAEEQIAKTAEKKDTDTRVAELSKNVAELKKLGDEAAKTKAAASAGAAAVAPAAPSAPAAVTLPVKAPLPAAPPAPVAAAPASAPVAAAMPASAPAVAAAPAAQPEPVSTQASAAAPDMMAAASVPESSPVAAAAPAASVAKPVAPRPAPAVTAQQDEPSFLGSLLDDNPLALALGGGLIALLAGFGVYRFTRRAKRDSGETSFLESRLQPDSFFGASGGQRIDTRDAGGNSSSMSYSLSQLDAIGDVDPVAEADVYLAYGRDLQAEEILKEAMRGNPERMAIRTKLLEVYAKRRDTKGFELLATQLYSLTQGQGEDWAKAQELGLQIDAENPLYQPGGAPAGGATVGGQMVEALGASTMPQSVLPSPSQFNAGMMDSQAAPETGVDLDLDLGSEPADATEAAPPLGTQPFATAPAEPTSFDFEPAGADLTLPDLAPEPARGAPASAPAVEFDLAGISLDLDLPAGGSTAAAPAPVAAAPSGFGESGLSGFDEDDAGDPLSRKLELAEEFRQIGDTEGARDLLQEVVSKASGSLKSKAQGMLEQLG
ncbi:FimV/HubP family polar landmark protein [uncultured Piscinibacter sp.]|uniref:FimV/HubP family polar landmark protein n=1 Tax=uncultured Piscinibacter sp. TaxID=1131835 RepID=UPI002608672D|nr:FimV/HubP family polar landmark protein [uncultured Piscinibacter sp.]